MCDNNQAPFKVGDKVKFRDGTFAVDRVVSSVFQVQGAWWLTYTLDDDKGPYLARCEKFELVPDPMVARREAYIAWYRDIFGLPPLCPFEKDIKTGRIDDVVNRYYDAIVATKHLFV